MGKKTWKLIRELLEAGFEIQLAQRAASGTYQIAVIRGGYVKGLEIPVYKADEVIAKHLRGTAESVREINEKKGVWVSEVR